MKIKGIHIKYNPVKEPIRKFIVSLELSSGHPHSADEVFEIAKPIMWRAIGWLLLSIIGFGKPELDYNQA